MNKTNGANSNIGEHRIIKNTPAVTKVAACIKADTGVGPSIAEGSHVCKPNCADLPTQPKNKKEQIMSKHIKLKPKKEKVTSLKNGANENTTKKSTDLKK